MGVLRKILQEIITIENTNSTMGILVGSYSPSRWRNNISLRGALNISPHIIRE
jgi:hypothetical protein